MNLSRREFTRLGALGLAAQLAPRLTAQSSEPQSRLRHHRPGPHRRPFHARHPGHLELQSRRPGLRTPRQSRHASPHSTESRSPASTTTKTWTASATTRRSTRSTSPCPTPCTPSTPSAPPRPASTSSAKSPWPSASAECEAMIDACKAANVKLMIAYRCHYETTNLAAVKLIRDGALGEVQQIQSAFGFSCGPEEWRLQKPLAGGGPLMDVGIYCLNATRYLTGEEPSSFSAYTCSNPNDPRFKTVEENLNWITKFPSGVIASCNTTYGAQMDGYFRVYGSKGWLEVDPAFVYDGLILKAEYRDANGKFDPAGPAEPGEGSHPLHQASHPFLRLHSA